MEKMNTFKKAFLLRNAILEIVNTPCHECDETPWNTLKEGLPTLHPYDFEALLFEACWSLDTKWQRARVVRILNYFKPQNLEGTPWTGESFKMAYTARNTILEIVATPGHLQTCDLWAALYEFMPNLHPVSFEVLSFEVWHSASTEELKAEALRVLKILEPARVATYKDPEADLWDELTE